MRALPPSHWHRLACCGSTNDEAQRLARAGAEAGTVVVAAEQSQGRGRLGRTWHSPRGESLYLSVVLRPPLTPPQAPLLGLCAGLALHRAVQAFLFEQGDPQTAQLRLKWPNDLLARIASAEAPFLKLGGILTELVCVGMDIDFVIIGVGCNIYGRDFPAEVPATSLHRLQSQPDHPLPAMAIDRVGELFLTSLVELVELYVVHGPRPIADAFVRAAELGPHHPPVVVKTAEPRTITGTPLDLGESGELILRLESGDVVKILAGDVALASSAKITS